MNLVVTVDDELLMLIYSSSDNNKKFDVMWIDIDQKVPEFRELAECKEITVDVIDIYNAKYMPMIYYTIYRLTTGNLEFYLLEQLDASFFFILLAGWYLTFLLNQLDDKPDKQAGD